MKEPKTEEKNSKKDHSEDFAAFMAAIEEFERSHPSSDPCGTKPNGLPIQETFTEQNSTPVKEVSTPVKEAKLDAQKSNGIASSISKNVEENAKVLLATSDDQKTRKLKIELKPWQVLW